MRPVKLNIGGEIVTLKIKGPITTSSVANISNYLEEAANIGTAHLKLDLGNVQHFDYAGIALLTTVLRSYAVFFEGITCCGLSQTIADVFREFGLEKMDGLRIS
jgi:anti-anti-sigma factor